MKVAENIAIQKKKMLHANAADSDFFAYIKYLLSLRGEGNSGPQDTGLIESEIAETYRFLAEEIKSSNKRPRNEVSFGTSGWRGLLGKDLFVKSVKHVTQAIVEMYLVH